MLKAMEDQELAQRILARATNHLWHWFSYISADDVDTYKAVSEATTILNNCVCLVMRDDLERLQKRHDALDAQQKAFEKSRDGWKRDADGTV